MSASDISQRTIAQLKQTRWPGWIWAAPVAAAAIVLWLALRAISHRGTSVTVEFDQGAGISTDSKVTLLGVAVGSVTDVHVSPDATHVETTLDINNAQRDQLRSGTQFYLEGARPSLSDLSSLKAAVAGPTVVMVPAKGTPQRHFHGLEGPPRQVFASEVPYRVRFGADVGSLHAGAPVRLRGFVVGEVRNIALAVDATHGIVECPVTLVLDPIRFHLAPPGRDGGGWPGVMNSALEGLVRQGWRARLVQKPPLFGDLEVDLVLPPSPGQADLVMTGAIPEIPADDAGSNGLMSRIQQLPLTQIADNVRAATGRLARLVSAPQVTDSLKHLDHSLAQLDQLVRTAGPEVTSTAQTLRETASEIDEVARSAQRTFGGGPRAADGNVQQTLDELTQTARAVRALADYLDAHPDALIRGR